MVVSMGLFKKESAENTAHDLTRTEQAVVREEKMLYSLEDNLRNTLISEARDIAKELGLLKKLNTDVEKLTDTAVAQSDLGDLEKPITGLAYQLFLLNKHFSEMADELMKTEQYKDIGESARSIAKEIDAIRKSKTWPDVVRNYGARGFSEWMQSLLRQKKFFSLLSERYSRLAPRLEAIKSKLDKSRITQ